jgi:hypothetical protein
MRRPPRRICPGCGRHHYAWAESQPCSDCASGATENRGELAQMARQAREARRQEMIDRLESRKGESGD